jgi:hypothetical protein
MAFENETTFIDGLKSTPDQEAVIDALFNDPDFKKIWDYLRNCQKVIVLSIRPGLKIGGVERFGGYGGGRKGRLIINPTKPEHVDNPMELVDTIVHECIHAVMDLRDDCGYTDYPFSREIYDLDQDPNIQGPATNEKKHVDPRDKGYLDDHYGDGASNPDEEYIDINDHAQRLIIRIIRRLMTQTGKGKETLTFENENKRNPKPEKKGCCAGVFFFLIAGIVLLVLV